MNAYLDKIAENFSLRKENNFTSIVVEDGTIPVTWGELETKCRNTIAELINGNIDKGVVLIFLPHSIEIYSTFLGCMLGGYIPSLMPCSSSKQDLSLYWSSHQELLHKIKPKAIFTTMAVADEMRRAGLELGNIQIICVERIQDCYAEFTIKNSDEIAFLQHSSGTTGLKKGVALTYNAIYEHAVSYGNSLQLDRDEDLIVSWLPTYHDMGLIACFITPAYHAVPTVQISAFDWLKRPQILFEYIQFYKATLCWLPNFAFDHLSNVVGRKADIFDLSTIRAFINCSEPCKTSTFTKFNSKFKLSKIRPNQLHCSYAMAETVFAVTQTKLNTCLEPLKVDARSLNRGDRVKKTMQDEFSIDILHSGEVVSGLNVDIHGLDDSRLDDGYIGEIVISGSFLFSGYNQDPERTNKFLSQGCYHTQDLGFMLNRKLYVLGRVDDLIIINGRNIYAHQVESIVSGVNDVKAGRSVALAHFEEKVGSQVLIILVERLGELDIDDNEIKTEILLRLSSEIDVVPRSIEIVEKGSLFKTSSGKISRKENLRFYEELKKLKTTKKAA